MDKRFKRVTETKKHTTCPTSYFTQLLVHKQLLKAGKKKRLFVAPDHLYMVEIRLNLNIFFKLCRAKTIRTSKVNPLK